MTDNFNRRLAPSSDALASRVGDETVILQVKSGTYFGLGPIASEIWNQLGEGLSPADICDRIAAEYDVDRAIVERDVRALLADFEAHQIVADAAAPDEG